MWALQAFINIPQLTSREAQWWTNNLRCQVRVKTYLHRRRAMLAVWGHEWLNFVSYLHWIRASTFLKWRQLTLPNVNTGQVTLHMVPGHWPYSWLVKTNCFLRVRSAMKMRARAYSHTLFSPVMMINWWMKLEGNRPTRQSPSLFDKWHGILYLPSRPDTAVYIPRPLITQSCAVEGKIFQTF